MCALSCLPVRFNLEDGSKTILFTLMIPTLGPKWGIYTFPSPLDFFTVFSTVNHGTLLYCLGKLEALFYDNSAPSYLDSFGKWLWRRSNQPMVILVRVFTSMAFSPMLFNIYWGKSPLIWGELSALELADDQSSEADKRDHMQSRWQQTQIMKGQIMANHLSPTTN